MEIEYLAHSPTVEHPDGQPLKEHLENVSRHTRDFAKVFGAEDEGEYAGILHDIGKYSNEFQKKLKGDNIYVDHSTAGAYCAFKNKILPSAFAIAGHHSGLPDIGSRYVSGGTLFGRMSKENISTLEDYSAYKNEVSIQNLPKQFNECNDNFYFYTKMLSSCLVDADWTDTSNYFNESVEKKKYDSIDVLSKKLDEFFQKMPASKSKINDLRNEIRNYAISKSSKPRGIFSLTVPTGGGKTLTSMNFALKHATKNNMDRIIYVIPYCSILEQTGKLFQDIFGKENVLLHYSTAQVNSANKKDENAFISEQWDQPIILTTSVQFFESLFSNKPSKTRKIHNICNSIIVFDEVQMLPVNYMMPCVFGICQLIKRYKCSGVLCTATQPAINRLIEKFLENAEITELCPRAEEMATLFKRTTYVSEGLLSNGAIVERMRAENSVLCIVNNRSQAQELFKMLDDENAFCLTTLLTPNDRKSAIEKISKKLKNNETCKVISTSLIEAGVDLDFPCVYRAVAGLDSIVQAGGRCNREGKNSAEQSIVHIFSSEAKSPKMLSQNISSAERVIKKYGDDITQSQAIKDYFEFLLYVLKDESELDKREILKNVSKYNFETVSEKFKMIDDQNDVMLYIYGASGDELIDELCDHKISRKVLREAASFAISLPSRTVDELIDLGKAKMIFENGAVLTDTKSYDSKIGFSINTDDKAIFY